jgi:hypothetical protein
MDAAARPGTETISSQPRQRRFLPVAAGLLALLPAGGPIAASGSAQTSIDFDGSTDFSRYKTYSWGQNTSSGNPVADEHIVEWIEAQLAAAGWTKVGPNQGDVVVAEHATVKNDTTVDTFYTGWGTGWGWTGFGPGAGSGTTVSQTLRSGTLVVDMFDASTKKLIWRGTAEGALSTNPEENYPKVEKIIARLFKKFPPAPAPAAPATDKKGHKPNKP